MYQHNYAIMQNFLTNIYNKCTISMSF